MLGKGLSYNIYFIKLGQVYTRESHTKKESPNKSRVRVIWCLTRSLEKLRVIKYLTERKFQGWLSDKTKSNRSRSRLTEGLARPRKPRIKVLQKGILRWLCGIYLCNNECECICKIGESRARWGSNKSLTNCYYQLNARVDLAYYPPSVYQCVNWLISWIIPCASQISSQIIKRIDSAKGKKRY